MVSLERSARRRRGAERSRLHVACVDIIDAAVAHACRQATQAPERERPVWVARVRKLEALAAWATVSS